MISIRKADSRGHAAHGWLDSWHTFSFGDYHDPAHMGFRLLRVMNEDRVAPGQGFGMHNHRDMEIVTYVLEGGLQHRDSLGNGETLRPGEFQRMTAGAGIAHSEWNASTTEPVHFYQIWIHPRERGLPPGYEQRAFAAADRRGRLQLVASPDGADGSLRINQDARIWLADVLPSAALALTVQPGRHAWIQVLRGVGTIHGLDVAAGDGVSAAGREEVSIATATAVEIMVIDMP